MEAPMINAPGKRRILPKTISPQTNSMSLKNANNSEISKGPSNSSKGKVISRIVYLDANTAKKILPTKPKFLISQNHQDIIQSQINAVEANNTSRSQALIADAELNHLIPARNLVEYVSALDNHCIDSGKNITIKENYGTKESNNVKNTENQYYTEIDKDSHQGVSVLPGRQLLNLDPFLSDSNDIELINDIDSLNTQVYTQEDPEKDHIIVEGYIPVASNTENKMDDSDILFTWGADSLLNDTVPVPNDSMMMVNPLTVEGLAIDDITQISTPASIIDNQPLATPQPNIEEMASDTEMQEVMKELDEEFLASILNDIEISADVSTTINEKDVPEEKNDLLKMVMDDSIGEDTVAQFCNVEFLTLNTQDITESRENDAMCTPASNTQEAIVDIAEDNVAPIQKRRGPGRPRKPRTMEKVAKPRGRPARIHLNLQNVMAEHHNYSNGGASNSKLSTDERRYRRMRDLNNVASQRCRLKRKQKTQNAFEDLRQEEEKNRELSMKVRLLEEQVAALKKHFIRKISNPRSVATTSAGLASQWDINQLEKFVDDAASKHLGK